MHRFKEFWVYCFAHIGLSDIIRIVRLITGECLDLQFSCSTNTFGFYLCFSHTFRYCTITVFQPQVLQNIIGYLATAAPRQHLFIKVYKLDSLIVLCKGMLPKCKDISKHSTSGKPQLYLNNQMVSSHKIRRTNRPKYRQYMMLTLKHKLQQSKPNLTY